MSGCCLIKLFCSLSIFHWLFIIIIIITTTIIIIIIITIIIIIITDERRKAVGLNCFAP